MSDRLRFVVGQKVKVVMPLYNIKHKDKICTVIDIDIHDNLLTYKLSIKKWKLINIWASDNQLEPVYDGNEKSSWSECAWKPKEKEIS